ncbi:hypothetical protein ACFWOG_27635 [Kitasatospora sp. NPDC058406]|uniref:phthiocerol/phthiodiolone dimycocerosyl transferase family protein n=1 Tax=Kitasatospora sp. NPDC058406 TaxID=3346483 RepID=UPI003669CE39
MPSATARACWNSTAASGSSTPHGSVGTRRGRTAAAASCRSQRPGSSPTRSARTGSPTTSPPARLPGPHVGPSRSPLSCVSAVDLRGRVAPAVPRERLVMGAGPVATLTPHAPGDDPRDRAPVILEQFRAALRAGVPELELLAAPQVMAELTGEATAAVTLSITNLAGRPLRLDLPPDHSASRLRFPSQLPGPFLVVLATRTPEGLGGSTPPSPGPGSVRTRRQRSRLAWTRRSGAWPRRPNP